MAAKTMGQESDIISFLNIRGQHNFFDKSMLRRNVAKFQCVNVVVIRGIGGVAKTWVHSKITASELTSDGSNKELDHE